MTSPFGQTEFVLRLKTDAAGRLTGFLSGIGDNPIRDGRVVGNTIQMTVETENFGNIAERQVTATLVGDELRLDSSAVMPQPPAGMGPGGPPGAAPGAGGPGGPAPGAAPGAGREGGAPGRGGFGSQTLAFRRGTPTPTYRPEPLDMRTLPPVELPALKDLPANGLAATPPMGWNSWNKFQTRIDDKMVRGIADAMVSSGMRDAGYVYINIDDGWQGKRGTDGVLQPNPNFPDMKALADYVHSKGLKLGLYSSPGPRTCAGYEGSYGHEATDAATWAAWGIDYLKYDWCSASRIWQNTDMRAVYQKMGAALAATGRKIVYSLCQYGLGKVEEWGARTGGNLWRTTGDIRDSWASMMSNVQAQEVLAAHAGPGHWNDPDMLEIGNGAMTADEYRTHMSLWAIVASPLIAGNDLRSMDATTKEILMNRDVIAVNQDRLGKQGRRVAQQGQLDIWVRELSGGAYAVALVNQAATPLEAKVNWAELGLPAQPRARDLWRHADLGTVPTGYSASIPAHGVVMLRLRR